MRSRGKQAWLFAYALAWVVLLISLSATVAGWYLAHRHEELTARKQFDEHASRIEISLREDLEIYSDVLHGAAALFAASVSVERHEWCAYVERVSVNERFPGIDGLGYIAYVPRDKLEAFLKTTRQDGAPGFEVKQPGTNADLMILKYLEPEARHATRIGSDIGANRDRRAVAELARDTGKLSITALMDLYRNEAIAQPGFLMLQPVYQNGKPTATLEERRQSIAGWVYGRIVARELVDDIMTQQPGTVRLEVLEKNSRGEDTLIFDTASAVSAGRVKKVQPRFLATSSLDIGQRVWVLRFTETRAFRATISRTLEVLAAAGGVLVSLLLSGIVAVLNSTRSRAVRMAEEMTVAFSEANDRLKQEVKVREHSQRLTAMQQAVTQVLAESESLAEAAPKIMQAVCESDGWSFGAFWKTTRQNTELICEAIWHREGVEVGDFEKITRLKKFSKGEGLPGRIWATGKSAWIKDVTCDENFPRVVSASKAGLHAAFGFPVLLKGQFLGVFEFFSTDIVEPDEKALMLGAALGSQAGQFIERKQAREELEREQFLMRTLMDNLPDCIYFKDLQSRILRNNRAHLAIFGLNDPADVVGRTDFDFFTAEHARPAYEDEQQVIRTGESITKEEKETWPDGRVTWALTTKLPFRDASGGIIGTFGISRDITDRKFAEEALRAAKEAAEEASRTKSRFLANMSHELRTPLNSVIGFAGILLKNRGGKLSPGELNFLERIQANGKHLLSLINEILDLSKIEAQKVELQVGPVSLEPLVRETIAQQEGLVRERPVQLLAVVPAKVATLQTDADKLRQVIINLIGNALKFTECGSVTVRVVTRSEDDKPVRIDVVDTGIGIPPEKLSVIFEAFQQADATTARKYGGTGLGLTISQALCELLGFHIEVHSAVGVGSTFSIVLCTRGEAAKVGGVSKRIAKPPGLIPDLVAQAPSELAGKLVLVIDDQSDSRLLLTHMFEEYGCQVIAANTGEQGMRMAREFMPQIITVDLLMPEMDGATVIRKIKSDSRLRTIPLVVVSIVADERRASILGRVDVMEKPVTRDELLAALEHNHLPRGEKVLVVDDDADLFQIVRTHLAGRAAEVHAVTNEKEALDFLDRNACDLVVLDLTMPVMAGVNFLDALRADPRFQQLPVLIITSQKLSAVEREQLRQQRLEFVKKPDLDEEGFKQLLLRVLRQAGSACAQGFNSQPGIPR